MAAVAPAAAAADNLQSLCSKDVDAGLFAAEKGGPLMAEKFLAQGRIAEVETGSRDTHREKD